MQKEKPCPKECSACQWIVHLQLMNVPVYSSSIFAKVYLSKEALSGCFGVGDSVTYCLYREHVAFLSKVCFGLNLAPGWCATQPFAEALFFHVFATICTA